MRETSKFYRVRRDVLEDGRAESVYTSFETSDGSTERCINSTVHLLCGTSAALSRLLTYAATAAAPLAFCMSGPTSCLGELSTQRPNLTRKWFCGRLGLE
ncbi:hypothetical protein M378DRAFT_165717 [Amanita muscaria Koide BX008]|uniref:Uncharacterized protein n=1 Tax=Amanita muscaria (strain Koide BX008) TaxID=946122 RepID=A0A0C2X1G0_AMAMK|nr:hypothetical protein M378DRAFT_165717 [Amanita muscaria Koide BX008]